MKLLVRENKTTDIFFINIASYGFIFEIQIYQIFYQSELNLFSHPQYAKSQG